MMTDTKRNFHALDGMRGLAAALVFTRHSDWFGHFFPYAHLAVDLFYMLSGFVLETAYGRRLASGQLGVVEFMVARWIRLWPLFALATLVSMGLAIEKGVMTGHLYETLRLVVRAAPNLLMLPTPFEAGLFIFVGVSWSIFYEVVVNVLFALTYRFLKNWMLALTSLVALMVAAYAIKVDTLDQGWAWQTLWIGMARVMFAFPMGVLLRRVLDQLPRFHVPFPLLLAATFIALAIPAPWQHANLVELVELALILPLLLYVGVHAEPSPRWFKTCTVLGVASYPLYILQSGFIEGVNRAVGFLGSDATWYAPVSGILLLGVYTAVAVAIEQVFDRPLRQSLTQRWKAYTLNRSSNAVTV